MSGAYRILVTGWRDWPEDLAEFIDIVLGTTIASKVGLNQRVVVVHGASPKGGVDALADRHVRRSPYFARGERWLGLETYPPKVTASGRILGPARNSVMVAEGADLCLAFPGPGSRGTWDCFSKAIRAGIRTHVFPLEYAQRWSAAGEPLEIL